MDYNFGGQTNITVKVTEWEAPAGKVQDQEQEQEQEHEPSASAAAASSSRTDPVQFMLEKIKETRASVEKEKKEEDEKLEEEMLRELLGMGFLSAVVHNPGEPMVKFVFKGGGKQGKSAVPQAWGGLEHVSLSCFFFSCFDRHTSRSAPSPAGLGLGRLGGLDGWAGRWGESHLKAELLVCLSYV